MNSLRHGLRAGAIVLRTENEGRFGNLLRQRQYRY
jgi:hypothetical protein